MHKIFDSQQEDEKIFLIIREHWFRLFVKLFVWGCFAAALPLFRAYGPDFTGTAKEVVTLLEQIYFLIILLSLFLIIVLYYLNVHVVTDIRVVDIDQNGLFSHRVSELHIDQIEDVTSESNGIFGTIFNYGFVYVQTAGAKSQFELDNIPNPSAVSKLILDLFEKNQGNNK